jgi:hypothetical protein
VKWSCKPLWVMALVCFKLAQAAVLPVPTQISPCPQHAMQLLSAAVDALSHTSCCKSVACDCLQAPALTGPTPQAIGLAGAAEPIGARAIGLPPDPSGKFFRPPIP